MSDFTKCPLVPYLVQLFGLGVVGISSWGPQHWHVLKLQKSNDRRLHSRGARSCCEAPR